MKIKDQVDLDYLILKLSEDLMIDEEESSLEKSLQKALDNSTPERPGCPWDS